MVLSNLDVVDIDGAVDMASTLTVAGVVDITDTTDSSDATGDTGALRTEGGASIAKKLYVGTDLDVDGTTNLDAVDIDGAVQLDATLTIGANDQGYDVILYGDTASANMTWDTSADDLIFNGAAGLIVPDGQFTLGSTAVSATAAEINLIDGGTSRGTTAVASGDGILINDAGTMRMTNVDTVSTYFAGHSVGGSNIVTTGALNSGSITSGFGSIDIGSSALSTTGSVTLGATSFGDNNITNVGDIALDSISADGTDINLAVSDNSATALTIKQGSDAYLIIDTANSSESVSIGTGISGTAISIGHSTSEVTFGDNVTVTGDFTVNGTTSTVATTNLTVTDPLVKYGQGYTGTAYDQGFIVTRGDGSSSNTANRGFIWDESGDEFATIAANTEDGTTAGNVTISDYAPLHVGAITADDNSTFSGEIAAASLDISGNIDVDGTTNLDIVDIDGAVDMASTLTVAGVVDITDTTDSSDATGDTGALRTEGGASIAKKLYVGTDLDVDGTANLDIVDIDGAVDMATTLTLAGNADFNGDLDVDGTTNLDVVDIDGAVDMATTLAVAGNVDFNGDLDVDGTSNLDVVDIDGAVDMASTLQVDGAITSSAGMTITTADNTNQLTLVSTDGDAGTGPNLRLYRNSSSPADGDDLSTINFIGRNDNSQDVTYGQIKAVLLDASDGTEDARLEFYRMIGGNSSPDLQLNSEGVVLNEGSGDIDFRVESNGNANMLFVDGGNNKVTIGTATATATLTVEGSAVAKTDTDTSNSGSVTLDFTANQNFVLTMTGNVTLANPSTENVGQSGFIACIQDGTGSRTLSLGTDYETAGGSGITLSTTAGATDLVPYVVIAANRILLGAPQLAFS